MNEPKNETPLPKDSPVMLAWEIYKNSDDYENTKKWALFEQHVDGSLWSAFLEGYVAGGRGDVLAVLRQVIVDFRMVDKSGYCEKLRSIEAADKLLRAAYERAEKP